MTIQRKGSFFKKIAFLSSDDPCTNCLIAVALVFEAHVSNACASRLAYESPYMSASFAIQRDQKVPHAEQTLFAWL